MGSFDDRRASQLKFVPPFGDEEQELKKMWQAQAPSNIALIKYMGKSDHYQNQPTNGSLSYTLPHLITEVTLELLAPSQDHDRWEPLKREDMFPIELSEKGQIKFLNHLNLLKKSMGLENFNFLVRSANNFPSDCGIASSASSFAALTLAVAEAAESLNLNKPDRDTLSALSRKGSGSSCRSFYLPWSEWRGDKANEVQFDSKLNKLYHMVVISSGGKKTVSSSEAHKRVTTSLLFKGRIERAEERLFDLKKAMLQNEWKLACDLVWEEFWDMHALFETAKPPFGYMNEDSFKVMNWARQLWETTQDGPMVTMDAGPNVHLLFRLDQKNIFEKAIEELGQNFLVLSNSQMAATETLGSVL